MSGGGEAPWVTGGQTVVREVRLGIGMDVDRCEGGGTGEGGWGDRWEGDGDRWLISWEDTVATVILGK